MAEKSLVLESARNKVNAAFGYDQVMVNASWAAQAFTQNGVLYTPLHVYVSKDANLPEAIASRVQTPNVQHTIGILEGLGFTDLENKVEAIDARSDENLLAFRLGTEQELPDSLRTAPTGLLTRLWGRGKRSGPSLS